MTDDNALDTTLLEGSDDTEAPQNPFDIGLTIEESFQLALFGATPELDTKIGNAVAAWPAEKQYAYGKHVATRILQRVDSFDKSLDELLQSGYPLPDVTRQAVRDTIAATHRRTFEEALADSTEAGQDFADGVIEEFNTQEAAMEPEDAYQNGYNTGKRFQSGWNTAQHTGEEILQLMEAEGGNLNPHTRRGIRDAYAHYVPAAAV